MVSKTTKFLVTLTVDVTDIYNEFASTGIEGFELTRQIWKHNNEHFENELFDLGSQSNINYRTIHDGEGNPLETLRFMDFGLVNKNIVKRLEITLGGLM